MYVSFFLAISYTDLITGGGNLSTKAAENQRLDTKRH